MRPLEKEEGPPALTETHGSRNFNQEKKNSKSFTAKGRKVSGGKIKKGKKIPQARKQ